MEIFICRHGNAEKDSPSGEDRDRALSPEGRDEIIESACFLKKEPQKIKKILTSAAARARESAELLQGLLGCEFGIEVLPQLSSGTKTEELVETIRKLPNYLDSFIIIGHMPDLGLFADVLLGNNHEKTNLRTGSVLKIELNGWKSPLQAKVSYKYPTE